LWPHGSLLLIPGAHPGLIRLIGILPGAASIVSILTLPIGHLILATRGRLPSLGVANEAGISLAHHTGLLPGSA
jgi:hypothetical protein